MTNTPTDRNEYSECDTVVIGAGQAGLSISYFLKKQLNDHVILERYRIGSKWHNRWDSFTLVTPNVMNNLPDYPSPGHPNEYLKRDVVINYLESFAQIFEPPLRLGLTATSVKPNPPEESFFVETTDGSYHCQNVVIATGTFQQPYIPACSSGLPSEIIQLHSDQYRNPSQLPDGSILVVGSGQSGAQIADELHEAGKKIYLSVSGAVRIPRRYRGRDIMEWLKLAGIFERTIEQLESPSERFNPNPHISGKNGGKTINIRRFGRDGMMLTGKVKNIQNGSIQFANDLNHNLDKADSFAGQLCQNIDHLIEKLDIPAPPAQDSELAFDTWIPPQINHLQLKEAGISSVIWATGYRYDYSFVMADVFDQDGYPIQQKGVTSYPGLYFVGMHWLHKQKSGLLYGVSEDAQNIAEHILKRNKKRQSN
ncbi:MAG: NAD(P)/FAD-dependent oxidoreductase [Balneolales bacterium]